MADEPSDRPEPRRGRRPLQAAGLRLPDRGDLRRPGLDLRLRPLRRPPAQQRQGRVVARDAARSRRHRRDRLGDPAAPADLGGLGPPRGVHRPPGPVPRQVQAALARGPRARGAARRRGRRGRDRLPELRRRALAATPVQPDVQDPHGPGRGVRRRGLPAPRDRPGDLRQLQERPRLRPQEAAVRDRPDRQVLPQRDHAGQLRLPDARVRADGDGVLRAARRGRALARALDGAADGLVHGPRHPARPPAPPRARRRRALPLLERDLGRRVPLPDGLVGARGRRQPRRLRPHPARQVLQARSSSTSTRRPATGTSRT